MRVVAGIAKGHHLKSPKGSLTRPTLDRVREAIFNVIAVRVPEANFLDLYAGTGAMGIEALSRGAGMCYFADREKKACNIVKENLKHCGFLAKAKVFNMDSLRLLQNLSSEDPVTFDLIYVDPPYEAGLYEPTLQSLLVTGLTKTGSLVIVESNVRLELLKNYGFLELVKKSTYGDTAIWYYQHT